jgi:hypothetical protein
MCFTSYATESNRTKDNVTQMVVVGPSNKLQIVEHLSSTGGRVVDLTTTEWIAS